MHGCEAMNTDVAGIDWSEAWKEAKAKRTVGTRDNKFWDRRAPSFSKHASQTVYPEAFLNIMNPEPHWTILDMACGGGTLAIPLAAKVGEVTAVDFSERMLDMVTQKCRDENITNVKTINGSWEDDWPTRGIGTYDVSIASRSLVVDDLRAAILKLDGAARERVYISTIVGDGPYDRRMFDALGRPLYMGPDYIYNYNLLYQMGIHARLTFIEETANGTFESLEDALNSVHWMLDHMTPEEEETLTHYLAKHLTPTNGAWKLDYDRTIRWAVMWWDKKTGGAR